MFHSVHVARVRTHREGNNHKKCLRFIFHGMVRVPRAIIIAHTATSIYQLVLNHWLRTKMEILGLPYYLFEKLPKYEF